MCSGKNAVVSADENKNIVVVETNFFSFRFINFFNDLRNYYMMTGDTLPCLDGVERALVLGVNDYSDWFVIYASDVISGNGSARPVVISKKIKKVK